MADFESAMPDRPLMTSMRFSTTSVWKNPAAAEKLLSAFDSSISRLQTTPLYGRCLANGSTDVRTHRAIGIWSFRHIWFFYRVDGRDVYIGRILHSRQDWLSLLFGIR